MRHVSQFGNLDGCSDEQFTKRMMGMRSEYYRCAFYLHWAYRAMEDGWKWSLYLTGLLQMMIQRDKVDEAIDELLRRFLQLSSDRSEWPHPRGFFIEVGKTVLGEQYRAPTKSLLEITALATRLNSPR